MTTYLITNRMPAGFTASAESIGGRTAWGEWLGGRQAKCGIPAFTHTTVGNCSPRTVPGGYTLVTAGSRSEAAVLAADHPLVSRSGGEVAEVTLLRQGRCPSHRAPAPMTHPGKEIVR